MERTRTLRESLRSNTFFNLPDTEIIDLLAKAFAPEIAQLKNASHTIETNVILRKWSFISEPSPSQRIFSGENYVEVNRSLTSILALKWLYVDDYEAFTCAQPPAIKLKLESFAQLRKLFMETLRSPDDYYSLLVATIVNDIGKDPDLTTEVIDALRKSEKPSTTSEESVPSTPIERQNHDMIVYIAADSHLVPLIEEMTALYSSETSDQRSDLLLGLRLGSSLNAAQLAQAENVPANLTGALVMRGNERAFEKKFLELLLDVAGADGHLYAKGAKAMSEPAWRAFAVTRQVLLAIVRGGTGSEEDTRNVKGVGNESEAALLRKGYDRVLIQRADMLSQQGFRALTVDDDEQRALLRLLTMSRTADKDQAEEIAAAFQSLESDTRTKLIHGLSVDGTNDGIAVLPYYIPALFAETLRATAPDSPATETEADHPPDHPTTGYPTEQEKQKRVRALASIMRFLARVYRGTKPGRNGSGKGEVVECDLSYAQGVIKGDGFGEDPERLDGLEISDEAYGRAFWEDHLSKFV
ncbi:hypothetical protein MMC25_005077 [Agyrium rufum]|nr:hypothetical protein [Agyrium rufum]